MCFTDYWSHLQQTYWELWMHLGGHPESEALVYIVRFHEGVHSFGAEGQRQMDVLQKNPAAGVHRIGYHPAGVELLSLTHRHGLQRYKIK